LLARLLRALLECWLELLAGVACAPPPGSLLLWYCWAVDGVVCKWAGADDGAPGALWNSVKEWCECWARVVGGVAEAGPGWCCQGAGEWCCRGMSGITEAVEMCVGSGMWEGTCSCSWLPNAAEGVCCCRRTGKGKGSGTGAL